MMAYIVPSIISCARSLPGTFPRPGTPTLANMFGRNVSASGFVPPEHFRKSAMTPAMDTLRYICDLTEVVVKYCPLNNNAVARELTGERPNDGVGTGEEGGSLLRVLH